MNGNTRHGHAKRFDLSPEYRAWLGMKARCYNSNELKYKDYGGRGITVCQRWLEAFEHFLADVGLRPSDKHSLGRKGNDGHYCPETYAHGAVHLLVRWRLLGSIRSTPHKEKQNGRQD